MKRNVEIVSLVYKSVAYLEFIAEQLKRECCKVPGWDVGVRVVLNDASPKVLERSKSMDIPITVYNDADPDAWYLERVYRCYNFSVQSSEYDNVCLINSDMMFSQGWLANLLKHHDGTKIPCSRLVESGKMLSGKHGIGKNFGRTVSQLNQPGFEEYAASISEDVAAPGGLYMPCVFEKETFIASGMYPNGNIHVNGKLITGDKYLFDILEREHNLEHVTAFDSIVYHVQEGEKDE